jgi:hypothetical protein
LSDERLDIGGSEARHLPESNNRQPGLLTGGVIANPSDAHTEPLRHLAGGQELLWRFKFRMLYRILGEGFELLLVYHHAARSANRFRQRSGSAVPMVYVATG